MLGDADSFFATGVPAAIGTALACAGLQLLAPDHLCMLLSLGTTTAKSNTLYVGAAWGFAHCTGTVAVYALVQAFRMKVKINVELWEHYGDDLIGASICLCALYFVTRERYYLQVDADGNEVIRACDCDFPELHATRAKIPTVPTLGGKLSRRDTGTRSRKSAFMSVYSAKKCLDDNCIDDNCEDRPARSPSPVSGAEAGDIEDSKSETTPLLGGVPGADGIHHSSAHLSRAGLWVGGAFLGLIQGLCCPTALASVNLLAAVTSPLASVVFCIVYMIASVAGAALLAFGCSRLFGSDMLQVPPRVVYRGSCALTLAFGVYWILSNRFEALVSALPNSAAVQIQPHSAHAQSLIRLH